MAYKNNIPQPTDKMNVSQDDLLNNFGSINEIFNINGYYLSLPNVPGVPSGTLNRITLYTNTGDLYVRKGTGTPYNITGMFNSANGCTRLPSGIILKWATDKIATGAATFDWATILAANDIPFTSYSIVNLTIKTAQPGIAQDRFVQLTSDSGGAGDPANPNTFSVYCSQRTAQVDAQCVFNVFAVGF